MSGPLGLGDVLRVLRLLHPQTFSPTTHFWPCQRAGAEFSYLYLQCARSIRSYSGLVERQSGLDVHEQDHLLIVESYL